MLLEQVYLLFIYILIFELAIVTGIVIVLLTTLIAIIRNNKYISAGR